MKIPDSFPVIILDRWSVSCVDHTNRKAANSFFISNWSSIRMHNTNIPHTTYITKLYFRIHWTNPHEFRLLYIQSSHTVLRTLCPGCANFGHKCITFVLLICHCTHFMVILDHFKLVVLSVHSIFKNFISINCIKAYKSSCC